jgi:phage-related protein
MVAAFAPLAAAIAGLFSGGEGSSPSVAASIFAGALSLVLNVVNGLAMAIAPLVSGALAELTTILSGLATIVDGLTTAIGGMISGDTAAVWEGLGTAAQGVADILTGTLQNALGVISGLLTALGTTITGTLSDWGFDAAAASVQGVIDNVTVLIDWLGQLAGGDVSIGAVMPEWLTTLQAWVWPEWTMPEWLTTLQAWVWPEWTMPEWLTTLQAWVWPEWTMPEWLTTLQAWVWPEWTMPEWISKLIAWAWPGFPSAPSWVTSLLAWAWPTIESAQWVIDLLAWAWPGIPGAGWIGSLLNWTWPTLPRAGWIDDLLHWDWPGLPALPSWLGGGGNNTAAETPGNNASGTAFWRGGLTWVGESGRELVQLPRGSQIYSNRESERMASGAQVTLYATVQNDIDVEVLAWRVADLIGARA